MARLIKYKAQCYKCLNWFEKGEAFLTRLKGGWKCQCIGCYKKKNKYKVKE